MKFIAACIAAFLATGCVETTGPLVHQGYAPPPPYIQPLQFHPVARQRQMTHTNCQVIGQQVYCQTY